MKVLGVILTSIVLIRVCAGAPKCGSVSNYAPFGKFTWLDTLGTIARNKADPRFAYSTIAHMLTDAAIFSVGAASNQLLAASVPSNLWDGSSTSFVVAISSGCGSCLLGFVNDVIALMNSAALSSECTHASGFVRTACLHSLSTALVKFNLCNDPGGSSDLVPGTGAPRCAQSELVALDANYGIYANLVNRALYGSYILEPAFRNALANLSCSSCFATFLTNIATYGTSNMIAVGACGPVSASSSVFTNACVIAGGSSVGQSANTISTAITNLEQCLGGGLKVALHTSSKSQLKCSTSELTVLSAYSLYKSIVGCALNDPTIPSFNTGALTYSATFASCMRNSDWSSSAFDLISGQSANSVTCWGCFGAAVAALSSESLTAFTPHFIDYCRGAGKSVFDPKCVAAITSSGILDSLAQCIGGVEIFSSKSTVCSSGQFSGLGQFATSAIPPIVAAHIAANNLWTSLSDLQSKRISGMNMFESSIGGNFLKSAPCYSCFRALVASMVETMQNSSDLRNACADVFSDACLLNSFLRLNLQSFSACSGGQSLAQSNSPYICTAVESSLIQQNGIPQLVFLISVVQKSASPATAIATLRSALRSISPSSLSCTPCLEKLINDFFALDATVVTKCTSAKSASDCLVMPGIFSAVIAYSQCSGNLFNFELVASNATNSTTTPAPENTTTTNTTKSSSSRFFVKSIFISVVINLVLIFFA